MNDQTLKPFFHDFFYYKHLNRLKQSAVLVFNHMYLVFPLSNVPILSRGLKQEVLVIFNY